MADEVDYVKLAELLASILAGIFVRANITPDEIARLNKISLDMAALKQKEQDIADGKV